MKIRGGRRGAAGLRVRAPVPSYDAVLTPYFVLLLFCNYINYRGLFRLQSLYSLLLLSETVVQEKN